MIYVRTKEKYSIVVKTVVTNENEDEQAPNVVVKEEQPWQIKYSADGKQILRAAPTSPNDPVEVTQVHNYSNNKALWSFHTNGSFRLPDSDSEGFPFG